MLEPSYRFVIDLPVRSEWASVDLIRSSVQTCFAAVFSNLEGCERLAMVTGELLENAVKYGNWVGEGQPRTFRLQVNGTDRGAQIRVENPVIPGDPSVVQLQQTLEWMRGFDDAGKMYRARLVEVAHSDPGEASQLGLMRMVYEGGCTLDAEDLGDRVAVIATFELHG